MIPNTCIKINTKKFPILDGEDEEIINENMYGKALCLYLEKRLPESGLEVPSYCSEDWGWWLEVKYGEFDMGLCIYSDPESEGDPTSYAIMPSIQSEKKWSWSKFRKIDVSVKVHEIIDKLEGVLKRDSEITNVSRHDTFPF
jgi:hypothetical protein